MGGRGVWLVVSKSPVLTAGYSTLTVHLELVKHSYMQVAVSVVWLLVSWSLYKPVRGNHTMYMHLRSYMMEG